MSFFISDALAEGGAAAHGQLGACQLTVVGGQDKDGTPFALSRHGEDLGKTLAASGAVVEEAAINQGERTGADKDRTPQAGAATTRAALELTETTPASFTAKLTACAALDWLG